MTGESRSSRGSAYFGHVGFRAKPVVGFLRKDGESAAGSTREILRGRLPATFQNSIAPGRIAGGRFEICLRKTASRKNERHYDAKILYLCVKEKMCDFSSPKNRGSVYVCMYVCV